LASAIQNYYLKIGGKAIHIIGHSYGGGVATWTFEYLKDKIENFENFYENCGLTLFDVPEKSWAFPAELKKTLKKLTSLSVKNYFSKFGLPYKLSNVEDIEVCLGKGDHQAPIYYFILGK